MFFVGPIFWTVEQAKKQFLDNRKHFMLTVYDFAWPQCKVDLSRVLVRIPDYAKGQL